MSSDFHHQTHPQLGVVSTLAQPLHSFWGNFSALLRHFRHLPAWGVCPSVSYLHPFSYCSWGSQGKDVEVVCHSLLQTRDELFCVGFSLLMVMPAGTCLDCAFCGGPTDISPARASVEAGPAFEVLIIRRTSTTIRRLWKTRFVSQSPRGYKVSQRESSDLGLCLCWGEGGVPRVLRVHSLLVNLKDKRERVEGKSEVTQMVSYLGHPELSKRGTSWVGQPGRWSSSV